MALRRLQALPLLQVGTTHVHRVHCCTLFDACLAYVFRTEAAQCWLHIEQQRVSVLSSTLCTT
jgi:hypothetical protein